MYSYSKLAELLAIIESEIGWASLRHREFINELWMKEDMKSLHPDLGGASHLSKYILATDKRMSWVASEIIYFGGKESLYFVLILFRKWFHSIYMLVFVGPISTALEYFMKVAQLSYLRNNFNSFFQIVTALGKQFSLCLYVCCFIFSAFRRFTVYKAP